MWRYGLLITFVFKLRLTHGTVDHLLNSIVNFPLVTSLSHSVLPLALYPSSIDKLAHDRVMENFRHDLRYICCRRFCLVSS